MAENVENMETEETTENTLIENTNSELMENVNDNNESTSLKETEVPVNIEIESTIDKNILETPEIEKNEKAANSDSVKEEDRTKNEDIENKAMKEANAMGSNIEKDENLESKIENTKEDQEISNESTEEKNDLVQMNEKSQVVEDSKNEVSSEDPNENIKKVETEILIENEEPKTLDIDKSNKEDLLDDDFIPFEKPEKSENRTDTAEKDLEKEEDANDGSTSLHQEDDKIEKTTEKVKEDEAGQSTSVDEEKTSAKRKLSDTPEDIINLLKNLSPEKLLEIKSKVLEITDKKETVESKKSKTDETPMETDPSPASEQIQEEAKEESKESSDVICLDSDDDDSNGSKESASNEKVQENEKEQENEKDVENSTDERSTAEKSDEKEENEEAMCSMEEIKKDDDNHSYLNGDSNHRLNLKECINPECPRNKDVEYMESPVFVLNMYYVARKPSKLQLVCSTCYEEALIIYEKLCSKFLSNETWTDIKIPKKQDLVEIIDSDEEDDTTEKPEKKESDESDLIIFDEEVERDVEEILTDLMTKIDIKMQLEQEYKKIDLKIKRNDQILADFNEELNQLERKSYKMYDELYSYNRPKIQRRASLSLDHEMTSDISNNQNSNNRLIPNSSEISITPVPRATSTLPHQKPLPTAQSEQPERICYAIRQRGVQMPHWMPCRILEELSNSQDGKKFKVQFCDNLPNNLTLISGKEISFPTYSEKLEIGARVIALFPRSTARNKPQAPFVSKRFLPGVIGEKLTQYNKRRYLVFCDYGQVRYCSPNEVRSIQESSENVWDDVHPNLRQFIRDYLESKTNRSRALLNVRVNTQILTERAGNWRKTIVQEVDCSLVKVYFTVEHVSEWLYRGSKRLYAMYQQTQRIQSNAFQRRNDPGQFSYITIDDDDDGSNSTESAASSEIKRNTAKKSTAKPPQQALPQQPQQAPTQAVAAGQPVILNDRNIYLEEPIVVGKVRHFTPRSGICSKKYEMHTCSTACIPPSKNDLSAFSPLSKPLLSCWERQIVRQRNFRHVMYKAPCGRRMRDMHEVFIYLNTTKSSLNVDNFDFDPSIQVLAAYYVDKTLCPLYIEDITEGKEGMKVICINAFDNQRPPPLEYSPNRIPMNGVNINTDPEFMSCCDCTDECVDKLKCACFQLTIRGAKYKNLMEEDEESISYYWKRLLSAVPTGIYECNSRCKCSDRCLNKVVQHPVRIKMQLYRTKARGWGLQTLHDIAKGTFVCIYAGNLYTEKDANALCQGMDHGDEYFAELDLIENAETRKEGYESGVVYPESEEEKASDSDSDYDDKKDTQDYDDGDFVTKTKTTGPREIVTRSSKTSLLDNNSKKSSASSTPQRQNSEDSSDDEMVSMIPNANNTGNLAYPENMRPVSFRKLYGPKEKVYIMDAKRCGNIGRYFNHSCDPNLFVQSVFVDTHDLRFPWIAFFAQRPIKAGEELTWNYNYEVGSVPSKVLYCKCGSKNCRGRIL